MRLDACERVKPGDERSSVIALLGTPDAEYAQLDIYYLGLASLYPDQTHLRVYYNKDGVELAGIYYSEESALTVCSEGPPFRSMAVDPFPSMAVDP